MVYNGHRNLKIDQLGLAMTTSPDHYAALQVDPGAEPEVIDAAYRRLAAKYHPDVNNSADALERMQQLNAAYEVLSNPDKRAVYDRSRDRLIWRHGPARTAPRTWEDAARQLLIPAGLLVFFLLSSRVGVRAGFIMAALLVALAYYWLSQRGRNDS